MSDSVRPNRQQPTRLPRPWDSPGKNTAVGCHLLLQCMKVKVKSLSRVWLFVIPWTAAYQAPPSMGFSRQEYWSGVPSPSPISCASHRLIVSLTQEFTKQGCLMSYCSTIPKPQSKIGQNSKLWKIVNNLQNWEIWYLEKRRISLTPRVSCLSRAIMVLRSAFLTMYVYLLWIYR